MRLWRERVCICYFLVILVFDFRTTYLSGFGGLILGKISIILGLGEILIRFCFWGCDLTWFDGFLG